MEKVKEFLKKRKWLIAVGISILSILYIISVTQIPSNKKVAPSATPSTNKIASFKSLVPGTATENDVNNALGNPISTTFTDGDKVNEYKSTVENIPNSAYFSNDKMVLFKETIGSNDNVTADTVMKTYGVSPNLLYTNIPNSSFNLYVYPSNGIAYVGHEDGTLFEIWYFQPTTIDEVLKTWGKDYSLNPSTQMVQ